MILTITPAAEARTDTVTILLAQNGHWEVPLLRQWAEELNEYGRIGTPDATAIPAEWLGKDRMVLAMFRHILEGWRVIKGSARAKKFYGDDAEENCALIVEVTTQKKEREDVFNEGETFGCNA